jgi:hypothetical protein
VINLHKEAGIVVGMREKRKGEGRERKEIGNGGQRDRKIS